MPTTIKVASCVEWKTVPGLLNHIHYYNSGHNLVLTTKSSLYIPVGVYMLLSILLVGQKEQNLIMLNSIKE